MSMLARPLPRIAVLVVAGVTFVSLLSGVIAFGLFSVLQSSSPPTGEGPIEPEKIEDAIVEHVNDQRESEGVGEPDRRDEIAEVALAHTQDMHDRDFRRHVNPDGESPQDRLEGIEECRVGVDYGSENIAWMEIHEQVHPDDRNEIYDTGSTEGLAFAFTDWWDHSEPHWENQVHDQWEYVGVGVDIQDGWGKATVKFC